MATVENVQLQVLNDKIKVTGRLKFTSSEIGNKYRVRIFIYADDASEGGTQTVLYSMRFSEATIGGHQVYATYMVVTAASTVNIEETDALDTGRLNEDPGHHWKEVGGTPVPVPNQDEVYAVMGLYKNESPNAVVAFGKSVIVQGVFA